MMMAIVVVVDSRESREDMESHERGFKALLLLSVFVLFFICSVLCRNANKFSFVPKS